MYCQDGKAPAKPMEGGKDDGKSTGTGREKESLERIQLLEKQVVMERERSARLEKAYEDQQQALRTQQEEAKRKWVG